MTALSPWQALSGILLVATLVLLCLAIGTWLWERLFDLLFEDKRFLAGLVGVALVGFLVGSTSLIVWRIVKFGDKDRPNCHATVTIYHVRRPPNGC